MLSSEHISEVKRERLLYQFFKGIISRDMTRAFERLLKQTGYATEFESVCFKSDFEPDEEEFERLSDREVIVQFEPPATGNSVDSYSIVLSFEEFLRYFKKSVKDAIERAPDRALEYRKRLKELKLILGVKKL